MSALKRSDIAWLWVVPVALAVVGPVILIESNGRAVREQEIAAAPVETTARVVEVRTWESGHSRWGNTTYSHVPTVEYTIEDGSALNVDLDSTGDAETYEVGEMIEVTYSAGRPEAVVDSATRWEYRSLWGWGWLLLGAGVLGMAFNVWLVWFFTRRAPR